MEDIIALWEKDPFDPTLLEKCSADKETSEFVGYLFMIKFGCSTRKIPEKWRYSRVHQLAVCYNPINLEYVPSHLMTLEMCKAAVTACHRALEYVPREMRTKEICDIAFNQNPFAMIHIPEEHLTEDMVKSAFQMPLEPNYFQLWAVPPKFRTTEVVEMAIANWGINIEHVPSQGRTPEMLKLAIKTYGELLKYFPEEERTYERCLAAVTNDGLALAFVPEQHKTLELCTAAIKNRGCCIRNVPIKYREQLYDEAIKTESTVIEKLPEDAKTIERCNLAFTTAGEHLAILMYLPTWFKTRDICLKGARLQGRTQGTPDNIKTAEFYDEAVRENILALRDVPNEFKTVEMIKFVVEKLMKTTDESQLLMHQYIPVEYINHSLFM